MVEKEVLQRQLKKLNLRFRMFGRAEIKELQRLLQDKEIIQHCVYGYYQGGSGLLVATDKRLLLIDKRPFFLNLEDIKFDSVRAAEFSRSYLQAALHLHTGMKRLSFKSVSDARLRQLRDYIQAKISELPAQSIENSFVRLQETAKPYLNPAWRARHVTLLRRKKPTKFYSVSDTKALMK
jgi:hypothetical protein